MTDGDRPKIVYLTRKEHFSAAHYLARLALMYSVIVNKCSFKLVLIKREKRMRNYTENVSTNMDITIKVSITVSLELDVNC